MLTWVARAAISELVDDCRGNISWKSPLSSMVFFVLTGIFANACSTDARKSSSLDGHSFMQVFRMLRPWKRWKLLSNNGSSVSYSIVLDVGRDMRYSNSPESSPRNYVCVLTHADCSNVEYSVQVIVLGLNSSRVSPAIQLSIYIAI